MSQNSEYERAAAYRAAKTTRGQFHDDPYYQTAAEEAEQIEKHLSERVNDLMEVASALRDLLATLGNTAIVPPHQLAAARAALAKAGA
jgi:hypothetical protein